MCKCLAGNVACCCFNCALSVLVSIISAFFVVIVVVGVIVYFVYYHEDTKDLHESLQDGVKKGYDSIKDSLSG